MKRLGKALLWLLVLSAVLIGLALAWILTIGISVDVAPFKERVENSISNAIGRDVWFRGDSTIELGRHPVVRVSGLHIRNGEPFDDADWLYASDASLQVDIWSYLRHGTIRINRFVARDVALSLEQRADGLNNWSFGADVQEPTPAEVPDQSAGSVRESLARLVIDDLSIARLYVEYRDPAGKLHLLSLPHFQLHAGADEPVKLALRGVADSLFPFSIDVQGAALSKLAESRDPWPLDMTLQALGATLTMAGVVQGEGYDFQLGLGSPEPAEAARILQFEMPVLGPTALTAQVSVRPGYTALDEIRGWMGITQMTGELKIDLTGPRPHLTGHLAIPELDLSPFTDASDSSPGDDPVTNPVVGGTGDDSQAQSQSLAQWYQERASGQLDFSALDAVRADLRLSVGRWLSLPGDVRDASLNLHLDEGKLRAPVVAQLAGVRMEGEVIVDGASTVPHIELGLVAVDTPLGEMADFLFGLRGVKGHLNSMAFRVDGKGKTIGDMVDSMSTNLAMTGGRLTYGNRAGQQPVGFTLQSLALNTPPGGALRVRANGTLLDQPLTLDIAGGQLHDILSSGGSSIRIDASSRSLQARIAGFVAGSNGQAGVNTKLSLDMKASRAGDAAAWLGFSESLDVPFALGGDIRVDGTNWSVNKGRLKLGKQSIRADVSQRTDLVIAKIKAKRISIDELQQLFGSGQSDQATVPESSDGAILDIPVLPTDIDLTDTDLSLQLDRIVGGQLDVRDLVFEARIREGRMTASPLSMTALQIPMQGALELDLRSDRPRAQWWLAASDANLGDLLRRLNIAQNLDASADLLSMHLDARGSRLGEVLDASTLTLEVSGGKLAIKDQNTGNALRVAIDSAQLKAPPGKPLSGQINGRLNRERIRIELGSGKVSDLLSANKPIPMSASIALADTEIELFGKLGRQFGTSKKKNQRRSATQLKLNLLMSGPRIDRLSQVTGVSLPPWGPYEVNSVLVLSPDGYEVNNLSVLVGQSQLDGTGSLDTRAQPPRLKALLSAQKLQLNDFRFGDWKPFGETQPKPKEAEEDAGLDTAALRKQAREASEQTQSLLSRETLSSMNGQIRVNVAQVLSGRDKLGNGQMSLAVEKGAARIGPVRVSLPKGSASATINYAPGPKRIKMRTRIQADELDYGFLARRVQPESELAGRISLNVDLRANTPSLAQAMEHSNGVIEFDVWPQGVQANVFDLWATNLFLTLATRLDPGKASQINCGIGRFDLRNGKLTHRKILLDTTRVRVTGEGSADFKSESVQLRMQPQPKKAEFFSLATPIVADGTFDDISIGAAAGDLAATAVRLATSLLWVPAQKLVGRAAPANGSDVCLDGAAIVADAPTPPEVDAAVAAGANEVGVAAAVAESSARANPTPASAPEALQQVQPQSVPVRPASESIDDTYVF